MGDSEGLSAEALRAIEAILPEDAPPGHDSQKRVQFNPTHKWPMAHFSYDPKNGGEKARFQTTLGNCYTEENCMRLARACYMLFESGKTQEEVKSFRSETYKRIREARDGSGPKSKRAKASRASGAGASSNGVPPGGSDAAGASANAGEDAADDGVPSGSPPASSSAAVSMPAKILEDAPDGHAASQCKMLKDIANGVVYARYKLEADGKEKKFTVSMKRSGGDEEDAKRILRLCLVLIFDGISKDEVMLLRQSLYDRCVPPEEARAKREPAVASTAVPQNGGSVPPANGAGTTPPVMAVKAESELTSEALKSEDAPPGSEAHNKVRFDKNKGSCKFGFTKPDGTTGRFQTTIKAAGGRLEDAMCIARACYHKVELGQTKDEVEQYRNELYRRLGGPAVGALPKTDDGEGGNRKKKRKRDSEDMKDEAVLELLQQQGRLEGALRLFGRDAKKKNVTVNGIYAMVANGYDGTAAWEKFGESQEMGPRRVLFFAKDKSRWKISEELGHTSNYAFLKVKDGGKSSPDEVGPEQQWTFFDGKEAGWQQDPDFRCVKLEGGVKRSKKEEDEVKKEEGEAKVKKEAGKTDDDSSDSASSSDEESDSEASDSSAGSGGSASSGSGAEAKAAAPVAASSAALPVGASQQTGGLAVAASARPTSRACAKMLVRAGLRCSCHFAYVRECPRSSALGART
mmetsp:Transcript_51924/g.93491  ORF Transcript_51924/g.93491 Transcript_51924/m.93491 type:complete len:689 (+) Transcript_51924:81-2147(+)